MKTTGLLLMISMFFNYVHSQQDIQLSVSKDEIGIENWNSEDEVTISIIDPDDIGASKRLISGSFQKRDSKSLVFLPSFPLVENTQYIVEINEINFHWSDTVSLSNGAAEELKVTSIYPTDDVLPANLLRMYISFSQPMKTTGNLERIKLIDSNGLEVNGAIFNNVQELWSQDQKQLTILFDPARIKTDLIVNKAYGRALKEGQVYQLMIEDVEDIYGRKLKQKFIKEFEISEVDLTAPNENTWKISIPKENSSFPLTIDFNSSVDKQSLQTRIIVIHDNQQIEGEVEVSNGEKTWQFYPDENWEKGKYSLHINARLEDPSGNNINGLFDHKIGELQHEREGQIHSIEFEIN